MRRTCVNELRETARAFAGPTPRILERPRCSHVHPVCVAGLCVLCALLVGNE